MANVMHNSGKHRLLAGASGGINWDTDTIKMIAVVAAYTPDADHDFLDDVNSHRHGSLGTDATIDNTTLGVDNTGDFAYIDADDEVLTGVAAGAAIEGLDFYKDTGSAATSPLVVFLDISVTPNGGNITIQFATPANGGIAKMT